MLVTNNDNVFRQLMYKVNGQYKKALIGPLQTVNLPDLISESQVFRNLFGLKVRKANVTLSRNLVEDLELEGPSPNFSPATIFSFPQQSWPSTATTISGWNTLFNLPTNGSVFSTLNIDGDSLYLTGGSNIKLQEVNFPSNIISIYDQLSAVTSLSGSVNFGSARNIDMPGLTGWTTRLSSRRATFNQVLEYVNFPNLVILSATNATSYFLRDCTINGDLNLPKLTSYTQSSLEVLNINGDLNLNSLKVVGNTLGIRDINAENININSIEVMNNAGGTIHDVSARTVNFNSLAYINTPFINNTNNTQIQELHFPSLTGWSNLPLIDTSSNVKELYLDSFVDNFANGQTIGGTPNVNIQKIYTPNLKFAMSAQFAYLTSLTSVTLSNLLSTDVGLLAGCSAITYVNLPLLTATTESDFLDCYSLTGVSLPVAQSIGVGTFENCFSLQSILLPSATTINANVFKNCYNLTNINLSAVTNLGGTSADDGVFNGITGKTITLVVKSALMTNNGGNPDGDIQYLQANNSVTVIQV